MDRAEVRRHQRFHAGQLAQHRRRRARAPRGRCARADRAFGRQRHHRQPGEAARCGAGRRARAGAGRASRSATGSSPPSWALAAQRAASSGYFAELRQMLADVAAPRRGQRSHARARHGQRRADGHRDRRALPARAGHRLQLVGCAHGTAGRAARACAAARATTCRRPAISRRRGAAARASATLAPVVLTQGFIASDAAGDTVLLGRGGSDTSGAYFAAKLRALRLEIWTDVPGMFSANPRSTPAARLLRALHYDEAQEIASSGAKVLHPRCILPVRQCADSAVGLRDADAAARGHAHQRQRRRRRRAGQGGVHQEGHHAGVARQPGHVARGRLPRRCLPDLQAPRHVGRPGLDLRDQRHRVARSAGQHARTGGARRAGRPIFGSCAACR